MSDMGTRHQFSVGIFNFVMTATSLILVSGYCPVESFSIGFNMSQAQSNAVETPLRASISTPVFEVVDTVTMHFNPFSTSFHSTLQPSMGIGWQ